MIRAVTYAGLQPGLKFLVLGAVHGNEKCGTVAIERVMRELDEGRLAILRGQVTFVPVCNPRAYDEDRRFIERNLNRYMVPMEKPDCYEAHIGNILCPMLEACDVHLAIHSYTAGGPAFIFAGDDAREHEFGACLGADTMLTGWAAAYAATGRKKAEHKEESTGTMEYAHRHGAISVTIECGQHKDPGAPEVAYRAIHNALRYLNMVVGEKSPSAKARLVTVSHVFYRDDDGKFSRDWAHLEQARKGDLIATKAGGEQILAPADGFIIMPHPQTPIGTEWFYFGAEA